MTTGTKRGRGRPAYAPDDETRTKVGLWIAGGIRAEAIAQMLGVSRTAVRQAFRDELATSGAEIKARVLEAAFTKAMEGNVAAQGKLLARFAAVETAEQPVKIAKLGKKEVRQAQAEKQTSAGRFAVPQPPKLVVTNS